MMQSLIPTQMSFKNINLDQILTIINMAVMVLLIMVVSLQNKSAGLSNNFGGGGGVIQTRRGFDKWLFYATIVLALLFVGLSITNLILRN
jgi:protein translocase SecG subunit